MSDENFNPDAPLHIRGLNHLTVPVKDRYRAARFFIVVLGGEAHHESAPDRAAKGLARSLQLGPLALDLAIRTPGAAQTLEEFAASSGLPADLVARIIGTRRLRPKHQYGPLGGEWRQ